MEQEAEAEAIEGAKRGEVEKLRRQAGASAMDARSEAFKNYGEAAILDLLVKVLPEVVAAASAPLAGVEKMTVISADGPGALGRSVAANVAQGLQLSGDLTGLDVGAVLRRLGKGVTEDGGAPAATRVQLDGDGAQPRS
ncbi:flotillin domain-containing protein [Modestobacter sp. I12A-02662]|uniref:flotillin domain-containing protein n=1 Tax=Modestobacter sp. I12A-02662 TaxID=1730496 RepID=UPI0034DE4E65